MKFKAHSQVLRRGYKRGLKLKLQQSHDGGAVMNMTPDSRLPWAPDPTLTPWAFFSSRLWGDCRTLPAVRGVLAPGPGGRLPWVHLRWCSLNPPPAHLHWLCRNPCLFQGQSNGLLTECCRQKTWRCDTSCSLVQLWAHLSLKIRGETPEKGRETLRVRGEGRSLEEGFPSHWPRLQFRGVRWRTQVLGTDGCPRREAPGGWEGLPTCLLLIPAPRPGPVQSRLFTQWPEPGWGRDGAQGCRCAGLKPEGNWTQNGGEWGGQSSPSHKGNELCQERVESGSQTAGWRKRGNCSHWELLRWEGCRSATSIGPRRADDYVFKHRPPRVRPLTLHWKEGMQHPGNVWISVENCRDGAVKDRHQRTSTEIPT